MKVKYKILLITVLVSLGTLIIVGSFSYFSMRKVLTKEVTNNLLSVAKIQKERLSNLIEYNNEKVALICSCTFLRISLNNYINSGDDKEINKIVIILNDAKNSVKNLNTISVLTLDGKVVASTDSIEIGKIHKNEEFFVNGQNKGISDIFYSSENNELMMKLSVPIIFNDNLIGVMFINANLDNITSFLSDYSGLGKTGYTRIVKKYRNGFLASSIRSEKPVNFKFNDKENFGQIAKRSLQKGRFVFNDVIDSQNKRVIAVCDFIENSEIGISVRICYSEAFSNLLYLKKVIKIIILLSVIFIILLSLYLSNSFVKPIINISHLADEISKGNFYKKIKIKSHDEIGMLANSFNRMSENLLIDITKRETLEKELTKSKEELQLSVKSLKVVQDISNAIRKSSTLMKVAEVSIDAMLKYTDTQFAVIFTYKKYSDHLKYLYAKGFAKEVLNSIKQFNLDDSLTGIAVKTKKVQFSEEMINDNSIKSTTKTALINSKFENAIFIPITFQNEVLGVMNLLFKEKQTYTETEKDTYLSIGRSIGMAFANIQYCNDLRKDAIENKQSEEKIRVLIKTEQNRTIELEESYKQLQQAQDASLNMLNDLNDEIEVRRKAEKEIVKYRDHLEYLVKERTNSLEKSQYSLSLLLEDVNDINAQLNKTNIKLNSANKELEAFSYSISHDLRAPLTRMDGFSQILINNYSDKLDVEGIHFLNRIISSSKHMAKLINDVLALSKISKKDIFKQSLDLTQLGENISQELMKAEPKRKVDFKIEKGLKIKADQKFVIVLLQNLLGNAFKFTGKKENAEITFGTKTIDRKEVFFIKDNGDGFDMKYYDKIYIAFQRLHHEEDFPGTGIGLAIVQRIINKHGGKIWAESEMGKGSVFYFRLG